MSETINITAQFANVAIAACGASDNTATPIVVRFAAPVQLNSVYASSLSSPASVTCGPGNSWTAPEASATPAPYLATVSAVRSSRLRRPSGIGAALRPRTSMEGD